MRRAIFLFLLSVTPATPATAADLVVFTDFPGGSAIVEQLDQKSRTVRVISGSPKDRGWQCWWYFKLSGITPGETITVNVGKGGMATPEQAFFSVDGREWRQTAKGERPQRNGGRMIYRQRVDAAEAWFAWGPPFVLSDANAFIEEATKRSPHATAFELAQTRVGRPVPALRLFSPGEPASAGGESRPTFWISARQHAWESGSSWVCRGLVEWLLSDDPRAKKLRNAVDFTIVPIMDVDSVEQGFGGKRQEPHDHNRDWSGTPIYPEVAAAMQAMRELKAADRLAGYIDLHNPAFRDFQPFFFVGEPKLRTAAGSRKLDRFLAAARAEIVEPLQLEAEPRPSGADYDPMWQSISINWLLAHTDGDTLAATLETPWNTPHSTPAGYQQVGRQLGLALERYLRDTAANRP